MGAPRVVPSFLEGGGEMGALMRAKDWSSTPLGDPATWPQSLRSAVSILLPSRAQIALFWGPELITLYNDAYRPVFGGKHPHALGQPIREAWSELWRAGLRELFESVVGTGEAYWAKDRPFYMERHGFPEETFFDVSYDPVRDESGAVGGVFCIVSETTARVVGERRLEVLRRLASAGAEARDVPQACRAAIRVLAEDPLDVPFAVAWVADGGRLRPEAACGVDVAEVRTGWKPGTRARVENELGDLLRHVPAGPWPEPPRAAMVLPIAGGALVLGLSSRLPPDDAYRGFCDLVAGQLEASLASARAAEEERRRVEALAELDRAKTAFFSNVSHEFRTPLTLMLGPVEDLLGQPGRATDDRGALEIVRRNGQRLLKLVNTLLDFARIEAGRVEARYEPTDLALLTAELASTFRSACERAGLALDVRGAPGTTAHVDREMWEKIVLNLISNAFKSTLDGGIRVTVSEDGPDVVLEVRDTGVGIPAEHLPRVFERFHRVDARRGRSHEGSGIGLALVQELVRLHGGTITAASEPGAGATFTVRIPRGTAHLPADRLQPRRDDAARTAPDASSPYVAEALGWIRAEGDPPRPRAEPALARVLLADDNADLRDYVRRLLEQNYEVETAADGDAALAAARRSRPDLVIADVMMPGRDGFGLLSALRSEATLREVPVMLLSARAGEEARVDALGRGADDYLVKPFAARELLVRVGALLRSAELRAEMDRARREFLDAAPALLWVTEPDGSCSFLSRGWYDYTGQTEREALGLGWTDAVHPEDRSAAAEAFRAANASRVPFTLDYRLRRHDGAYRWAIDTGRPRFDGAGQFVGFVGSVIDVHERREAEDRLRESEGRKDEFIATLSHELRNPLAPLRNGLHLVRLSAGPESARVVAMMQRQLDHLVRLTDDLLEMSRITRGALELRREVLDLPSVVRHAVETSATLVEERGHRLTVDLEDGPLAVNGDPVRLGQIFSNLVNNAARYTPPGGSIEVRARREGGAAVVSVRDSGHGIAPAQMGRLFQMFARGDRSSGLGIGLALARRLAEMHDGTIEAASDGAGLGAEFTVRLPLAQVVPAPASAVATPGGLGARRILVVDDNQDAAESLAELLESLGAEVRVAHDGRAALEAFEDYRPAVVLLDIGMPGMDGYEVARTIRGREDGRGVSLVALTGWGQEDDRRRTSEAGFDHHLVKPAEVAALHAMLASLPSR